MVKLALFQSHSPKGDLDLALDLLKRAVKAASSFDADILIMPELFLPGYNVKDRHHTLAQAVDSACMKRVAELAKDNSVHIITGYSERAGTKVYNSAAVFCKNGELLQNYRKHMLYGPEENRIFTRAKLDAIFSLDGTKCALLICYDVEFADKVRHLARQGVEVLLVPTANMVPFDGVSRYLVPARAMENGIIIAYANYCGKEGELTYSGSSCIVDQGGNDLARAGAHGECLLIADLEDGIIDPSIKSTQLVDLQKEH